MQPFWWQKNRPPHNKTLSVARMRVSNEHCSPARIHGCDAAPTPAGFAEVVSDVRGLEIVNPAERAKQLMAPLDCGTQLRKKFAEKDRPVFWIVDLTHRASQ